MAAAAESGNGYDRLKDLVQGLLDRGVPAGELLAELQRVRSVVSEDVEDLVLEVMDVLSGWCAPHRRLVPRIAKNGPPPRPGRNR
jgi:hypothetical protein